MSVRCMVCRKEQDGPTEGWQDGGLSSWGQSLQRCPDCAIPDSPWWNEMSEAGRATHMRLVAGIYDGNGEEEDDAEERYWCKICRSNGIERCFDNRQDLARHRRDEHQRRKREPKPKQKPKLAAQKPEAPAYEQDIEYCLWLLEQADGSLGGSRRPLLRRLVRAEAKSARLQLELSRLQRKRDDRQQRIEEVEKWLHDAEIEALSARAEAGERVRAAQARSLNAQAVAREHLAIRERQIEDRVNAVRDFYQKRLDVREREAEGLSKKCDLLQNEIDKRTFVLRKLIPRLADPPKEVLRFEEEDRASAHGVERSDGAVRSAELPRDGWQDIGEGAYVRQGIEWGLRGLDEEGDLRSELTHRIEAVKTKQARDGELRIGEAAALLGVTVAAMRRLLREGIVPSRVVDGRRVISAAWLLEYRERLEGSGLLL